LNKRAAVIGGPYTAHGAVHRRILHAHGRKVKYIAVRPRVAIYGAVHRRRTLHMVKLYATDRTDVRTASSWKPWSLEVAWTDGRSPVAWPGLIDGALV